jgi:hypothetical protein
MSRGSPEIGSVKSRPLVTVHVRKLVVPVHKIPGFEFAPRTFGIFQNPNAFCVALSFAGIGERISISLEDTMHRTLSSVVI